MRNKLFDRLRLAVSLCALAAVTALSSLAQAPVGSITGTVKDQTGLVMVGVTMTVTNKDTGATRSIATSSDGIFSASSLPPGNYVIKATMDGFRPLEVNVTVQVGQVASPDLVMEVGVAGQEINVQAESSPIEYTSHELSNTITQKDMQALPLNGRSFLELSSLTPGVTSIANNVGQFNKQFDVNVLGAGSAAGSIRITVDGATVQDSIEGGTQQNFSQEVVQEFQISSTNFDLSTGIGAGGAINIVTRSGSNDFHGNGFFFYRDHNMSAFPTLGHDPGEPTSPYFARQQEGYWIGGPIKKDTLFFFSALEHTNQTALISAFPSDPAFYFLGANAQSPYHANELTERFDWHINSKNSAFLRYSHDGNNSFAPPGLGDLPSDWNVNKNWADSGVVSLISVLTQNTSNEFRYSYTFWSNSNEPPTLAQCPAPCYGWDYKDNVDGPQVTILGVNNFAMGQAPTAPQTRLLRRHSFADNVSSQKGKHSIKFGGYWEYQHGTGSYAYADPAAMELYSPSQVQSFNQELVAAGYSNYQIQIPSTFTSVEDLLKLPVKEFTIGIGDPQGIQPPPYLRSDADHDNSFHAYAEDSWKIKRNFTLNYGLGWSFESNALNYDLTKPSFLEPVLGADGLGHEQHQPHDFSPMLGFAWTVGKDNKTVIRGGSAIYYDTWNILNRLIERVIIGPAGTGRIPLPDEAFFPAIAKLNGFANFPSLGPTSCGQSICSFSQQPTTFNGYELQELLFSILIPQADKVLYEACPTPGVACPNNNNISITNADIFKTTLGLIPTNFKLPYSEQASIGVQRQLLPDLVLSADFVFRQYINQLIENADINHFYSAAGPVIPACTSAEKLLVPGQAGYAPCSNGPVETDISGARSHYKGLLMKLDKRFSHHMAGTLAYAYADEMGYNGLIDNSNWMASWGPQAGHQTLTGSLMVNLPGGILLSGITTFQSAAPFQPYISGIDLNGNGVFSVAGEACCNITGSPLPGGGFNNFGVTKSKADLIQLVNQFNQQYAGKTDPLGDKIPYITLPANWNLPRSFNSQDLRISKIFALHGERWKLSIFGECFNLFNIANLTNYNAALNAPDFGQATLRTANTFGTGGPRAFQLGSRIMF